MGIIVGLILIGIGVAIEKYESTHYYRFNSKMERVKVTKEDIRRAGSNKKD